MLQEFPSLFEPVKNELETVFEKLNEILQPIAKLLLDQAFLPTNHLDCVLCPGLVLSVAHLFGKARAAILPALFGELIYLATTIHNLPSWKNHKAKQLLILTGDYLYGHLFFLLCKSNCLFLLERLARLITEMNEGFVLWENLTKNSSDLDYHLVLESLKKQDGIFFGEACALGAFFAGANEEEQQSLYQFGVDFGIAYGVKKFGMGSYWFFLHLDQALNFLSDLPVLKGKERLEKITRSIILPSAVKGYRTVL